MKKAFLEQGGARHLASYYGIGYLFITLCYIAIVVNSDHWIPTIFSSLGKLAYTDGGVGQFIITTIIFSTVAVLFEHFINWRSKGGGLFFLVDSTVSKSDILFSITGYILAFICFHLIKAYFPMLHLIVGWISVVLVLLSFADWRYDFLGKKYRENH